MSISLKQQRVPVGRDKPLKLGIGISPSLLPIALLVMLYSCQIWRDIAGITIRSEDLLIIALLFNMLLPTFLKLKLRYRPSLLNGPILVWMSVIAFSVLLTIAQPFDSVTKKDALVNGIRVMLAFSTFFIMYNHPASARAKIKAILKTTIWFSFITTVVSVLQIGYWDGWLPLSLPAVLIEKAAGANMQKGREIFALFIGDTGAHMWSGMLAFQALTVFLYAQVLRNPAKRWFWYSYFGLLTLILLRTAVRNSILGLFVGIVSHSLLKSRHLVNRVLKLTLLAIVVVALVLAAMYLKPNNYFIQRALAIVPQISGGQIVISGASSIYGRFYFINIALRLFRQNPLTGHGFYSYQALSTLYSANRIPHAHNSYLQILSELGLVGAVFFGWLASRISKFLRYLWSRKPCDVVIALGINLLASGVISVGFTALFSNLFWDPRRMGFLALLLGALASYRREIYLEEVHNDG